MGNERTLKLIASAAQKLPRLDPDYAARMVRNRARRHRARLRVVASEYEAIYARFVTRNDEPEIEAEPPSHGSLVDDILTNDRAFTRNTRPGGLRLLSAKAEPKPKPPKIAKPKKVKADVAARGRVPKRFEHDSLSLTLMEWSERLGMPYGTIRNRIRNGFTIGEALTFSNSRSERPFRANRPKQEKQSPTRHSVSILKSYEYNNESMTLFDWAKRYDISPHTLCTRLRRGWQFELALTTKSGAIVGSNAWRSRGWVQTSADTLRTGQLPPRDIVPE